MKRILKVAIPILLGVLVVGGAWWGYLYQRYDHETRDLNEAARRNAGGQFAQTPLGLVHYQSGGPPDARVVVLIHGFSVPYYLWDPTFDALVAAGFHVIRYDLFGRGYSDRPDVTYNGDLYDQQLYDLLDALHIQDPVDLVASSMGGPIATTFACRLPDKVRTITLFDPGYSHGQTMPFSISAPLLGEYTMASKIAPNLPRNQLADFAHPEQFPDWTSRYQVQMQYKGFRRALLSTLRDYLVEDWSRGFACVGQSGKPVLLIWGKEDKDVPFSVSKEVLADIPKAEFLAVDDSAHVPFLEHPEIVNPALIAFLLKH